MARYGRQGPVGMGGWLAVLVATLLLNAAAALTGAGIIAAGGAARMPTPGLRIYMEILAVLSAVRSAGFCYLAWRLIAIRRPLTVRVVVIGLWLLAFLVPLVQVLTDWHLLNRNDVLLIGYAAIWTAYLLRSDRVANAYAPPEGGLAIVFG